MSNKPKQDNKARADRLAEALRQNLRRRKLRDPADSNPPANSPEKPAD